jgi:hypothetical protein
MKDTAVASTLKCVPSSRTYSNSASGTDCGVSYSWRIRSRTDLARGRRHQVEHLAPDQAVGAPGSEQPDHRRVGQHDALCGMHEDRVRGHGESWR